MSARYVYDVYDNRTDEPIIIGGTARECARTLGIRTESFRTYICRRNGIERTVIKYMRPDRRDKFGARLKSARIRAGLSQADVALKVGLSVTTYKNYEQGRHLPDIEIAAKLAQELQVSLKYLAGGFYHEQKKK